MSANKLSLKERLHASCVEFVQARISALEEAIRGLQLSANEETKSSAGDKYETGRAMAQLEIEKNMEQLGESRKMMTVLDQMNLYHNSGIRLGSLVMTDQGNFYIAISAGKIVIDKETYFAVSPASPIGQHLMSVLSDSTFVMNGKRIKIISVL